LSIAVFLKRYSLLNRFYLGRYENFRKVMDREIGGRGNTRGKQL